MTAYEEKVKKEEEELQKFIEASQKGSEDGDEASEEDDEPSKTPDTPNDDDNLGTGNPEDESWKKRYGDLRRHQQQKDEEHKAEIESLRAEIAASKSNEAPPALPENIEELEEWKKRFPDVARIMTTLAEQMAEEKFKDAKFDLEELKLEKRKSQEQKNIEIIKKSHPDFDELGGSDDFQEWANEQPKWVQTALFDQKDDPKSVVRAIDLYKMDKGLTSKDMSKAAKEAAKAAAAAVTSKSSTRIPDPASGKKKIKESWVEGLTPEEFEKYEEEIMEAQRTGNFIRDLSAR